MMSIHKAIAILCFIFFKLSEQVDNNTKEYKTINLQHDYFTNITVLVDQTEQFIIKFPKLTSHFPYVVSTWSDEAQNDYPIFIMVTQQKEAISWEIPLLVDSKQGQLSFYNISRTLCHNRIALGNNSTTTNDTTQLLSMFISTYSKNPVSVTIRVELQETFVVERNHNYSVTISPSQSSFFYYNNPNVTRYDAITTIVLEIDSQDEICLTVSIQNSTCPVFDLNENIKYQGQHETIQTRGGIIINEPDYPNGFFIVYVAKGDDFDCIQKNSPAWLQNTNHIQTTRRLSEVTFKISPNISKNEYVMAVLITLSGIVIFYLLFIIIASSVFLWTNRCRNQSETSAVNEEEPLLEESSVPSNTDPNHNDDNSSINAENALASSSLATEPVTNVLGANDSDITVENQTSDSLHQIDSMLRKSHLYLSDLATREPHVIHKESLNYFFHVISIGTVYCIPVLQFVVSQQRILTDTGNLDICYYNFLCAHPLGIFNDFNHFISNIAYIAAGGLFFLYTVYKQNLLKSKLNHGIPRHYGLYYAMSAALIMEGILSASYHVCPNKSNFQFDTSFMYVMAVLCIVKLYQNRHPDINATAYVTFTVVAAAILIAMVGILDGIFLVWGLFINFYMIFCFYLIFSTYFLHHPKRGVQIAREVRRNSGIIEAIKPVKKSRYTCLVTAFILNIVLVNLGYLFRQNGIDFGTFLLIVLMGNAFLYTLIYIIMKKVNKERIPNYVIAIGFVTFLWWCGAAVCFFKQSAEWTVTPSESRKKNTQCIALDFYDFHDIWHILSAIALFFTFVFLSILDVNLMDVHHEKIAVF